MTTSDSLVEAYKQETKLLREEIADMRRCLRDVLAISALPEVWLSYERKRAAESLATVLLRTLPLEFVYVPLLPDAGGVVRGRETALSEEQAEAFRVALEPWIRSDAGEEISTWMPNPLSVGSIRVARLPIGLDGRFGSLIVGSKAVDFPTDRDRVALGVAVNQLAVLAERKLSEASLQSTNDRLKLTQEAACLAAFEWNIKTGAVLWSGAIEKVYGFLLHDYEDWWSHVHPDDKEPLALTLKRTIEGGAPYDAEYRFVASDGRVRWLMGKGQVYLGPDGKPDRLVGVNADISTRKAADEALKGSEAYFRSLVNDIPLMIWTTDKDARGTFVNRQWCEYTGQALEEAAGAGWATPIHEGDRADAFRVFAETTSRGLPFTLEYRLRSKDGSYRWMMAPGAPRFDEMGNLLGYIGAVIDISERRAAEQELRGSEKKLQLAVSSLKEADRRKDEFLAVLSHELRSPLNVIAGHVELLRLEEPGTADFEDSLQAIERNTKTQNQMIGDLLDISRIITGKMMLELKCFEVESVVKAAADAVRFAAEAKGVRLETRLDPGLGMIVGDDTRLQQVFWNLLSNAVKFTPKGGRVTFSARKIDSLVEFVVVDTGQGISPEFLPYVFDRFHQEDASKTRKYGGLGLGLAIVRHIAELHGGSVRVESPGKDLGTGFFVVLPVKPVEIEDDTTSDARVEQSEAPAAASRLKEPPAQPLERVRILVVDDQPDARDLLKKALGRLGAAVTPAESAEVALVLLEREPPDVLVSDVGMPVMNGLELIKEWRAREQQRSSNALPALALTAYATESDRGEALAAGFQKHFSKPVKISALVDAILVLLGRNQE